MNPRTTSNMLFGLAMLTNSFGIVVGIGVEWVLVGFLLLMTGVLVANFSSIKPVALAFGLGAAGLIWAMGDSQAGVIQLNAVIVPSFVMAVFLQMMIPVGAERYHGRKPRIKAEAAKQTAPATKKGQPV